MGEITAIANFRRRWHRACHYRGGHSYRQRPTGGDTMRIRAGTTIAVVVLLAAGSAPGQFVAKDPGPRWNDPLGAGKSITGLTTNQQALFDAGKIDFSEREKVADGLGPRFNLDSCAGCHLQPDVGGSSPTVNPQVQVAGRSARATTCRRSSRPTGRCARCASGTSPTGRLTAASTRSSSSAGVSTDADSAATARSSRRTSRARSPATT